MDRATSYVLGLGLLVMLVIPVFAHEDAVGSEAKVTVRLFNAAGVDKEALTRALTRAGWLLEKARMQIAWLDCTPRESPGSQAPCQQPARPTDLLLAIIPRIESSRPDVCSTTLGYAVIPAGHTHGHNAYISYGRATELARQNGLPPDLILGFAMAHEIGHLLLASNDHTGFGIMRAVWDSADWQRAARGELAFTATEGARLRAGILARVVAETVRAAASQPRKETSTTGRH